ncbi:uncharacterized protein EAE98_008666 [Botrytis deweyae]|uniref:Uncharacterized protein n=1 Tax=Botrytis deweyae TaxID=2478750 RepID=A0ABQ7IDT5_9HELO|nr:uncharacterized protein EAE98_008666 [Botrytis deweyae]KAF7921240.1 hypothetical protein EAE98_008666 [Botrytis deweyae]
MYNDNRRTLYRLFAIYFEAILESSAQHGWTTGCCPFQGMSKGRRERSGPDRGTELCQLSQCSSNEEQGRSRLTACKEVLLPEAATGYKVFYCDQSKF